MRSPRLVRTMNRFALPPLIAAGWTALAIAAPAPPPVEGETQHVEVVAAKPYTHDGKSLAQLFAARTAFEAHRALAPQGTLAFRLYLRKHPDDVRRLRVDWVDGDERRPIRLDEHQRFVLDPAWTPADAARGVRLEADLPDGDVAWHVEVRSPGFDGDTRRLGDLRLECEADMFHGDLQRGIRSPGAAFAAADDTLCKSEDGEIWFADAPVFGVTLEDGARRFPLPYRYVHCSDGSMAMAAFFDWPYALRDRSYFLPLEDTTWSDETRVVVDHMADPQPASGATP